MTFQWPLKLLMGVCLSTSLSACLVLTSASESVSDALGGASTSLESVSTSVQSISGSFGSSIASSAAEEETEESEKDESFRRDIRNYTAAFITSGGTPASYERELSRIARLHGIVNWRTQGAAGTFEAIGAGLFVAGLDRASVDRQFRTVDDAARRSVLIGFDRESRI